MTCEVFLGHGCHKRLSYGHRLACCLWEFRTWGGREERERGRYPKKEGHAQKKGEGETED